MENDLAVIAAGGTAVSIVTLVCTLWWRWMDNRISMTITFTVGEGPANASPDQDKGLWIIFNALNSSPRATIYPAEVYLQADNGRRLPPMYRNMPGYGTDVLRPGSPATYSYPMSKVAEFLQAGGEHSGNLVFVVRDGTGELHEQKVQIEDDERLAEGSQGPDPLPVRRSWWRRLLTGSR
jgi:hypothetical protein